MRRLTLQELIDRAEDLDGMRKAFDNTYQRLIEHEPTTPGLDIRKERARFCRDVVLNDQRFLDMAVENLRGNGFKVIISSRASEACGIILDEINGEHLVVKSKSNVSKEIGLTSFLEERGVEVVETDAGDRIVQLSGTEPQHPLGPAVHLTRYQVAEILSKHFGREIPAEPDRLTEAIRQEISSYIAKADVGITGANFITVEEGAVVIVHNEGNVTACARRPRKQIIISSIDKLVPNLDDAMNMVRLQTLYGTGKIVSSFIDIIGGRSMTADIEKIPFYGMHGPTELVLVLLDNRRSSSPDKEDQYCINCGACLLKCPVYDAVGNVFGGRVHHGGRGLAMVALQEGLVGAVAGGLFLCTQCGLCKEMCPVGIDGGESVQLVRWEAIDASVIPDEVSKAISHFEDIGIEKERPRHLDDLAGQGTVLFPGCTVRDEAPELLQNAQRLLRELGLDIPTFEGIGCCGWPLNKLGAMDSYREVAKRNLQVLRETGVGRMITLCPGCKRGLEAYKALFPDLELEIVHVLDLIQEAWGGTTPSPLPSKVRYFDPCDLGRGLECCDVPRQMLRHIPELDVMEMPMSKERSVCCGGAPSTVATYPELSGYLAKKRVAEGSADGVERMITACPNCYVNLRVRGGGEVEDLLALLLRSIS